MYSQTIEASIKESRCANMLGHTRQTGLGRMGHTRMGGAYSRFNVSRMAAQRRLELFRSTAAWKGLSVDHVQEDSCSVLGIIAALQGSIDP